MENIKLDRPDLSFLTKKKFKDFKEACEFYAGLKSEQKTILRSIDVVLPELIQIAEMYFDEKKSNPDSLVFQMVSKLLNDIKAV